MRRQAIGTLLGAVCVSASPLLAQVSSGARAEESRTLALATQMERSGQPGEAERVLIELLASQPAAAGALAMLAQLGADRGAPELVLPYAEAAAELAGYDQATIHQVLIRALADSGFADEALETARAWVAARPTDTAGYAELASALARLGRRDEAIAALVDARTRTGDPDVFAQELALLYMANGEHENSAREWLRVLGWGDVGVSAVEAHLRTPGVEAAVVVAGLQGALRASSAGLTARMGALELAVRTDRAEWSRELAETLAAGAPADMRWQLLRKYYLDARDLGWVEHARWAAARLTAEADDDADRLQWQAVEASLAMEQGDRVHAAEAFDRVLGEARRGSETRRLAMQSLVVLRADEDPRGTERLVRLYGEEFPDREVDLADLAIRLSRSHVGRADLTGARRVLGLAPGQPEDASTAARLAAQHGYLSLFEGDAASARSHLETAGFVPGGEPSDRTEVLLFLDVMDRADPEDVTELGRGIYDLQSGVGAGTLVRSAQRWQSGRASSAAGLMRLAAGALERALFPEQADEVRLALVQAFPGASETPGALLSLARSALADRPGVARSWLERLVIDHPESALAPVARRILSELGRETTL